MTTDLSVRDQSALDLAALVDGRTGESAATALGAETGPGAETTETTEPSPAPSDSPLREDLEANEVSPGLPGFLAIFVVVIVTIPLLLSMTRKLRKVNHAASNESTAEATFDDRRSSGEG